MARCPLGCQPELGGPWVPAILPGRAVNRRRSRALAAGSGVRFGRVAELAEIGGALFQEGHDGLDVFRGAGEPGHGLFLGLDGVGDRKSTRLNSSHVAISYAVFCLKKKKKIATYKDT